MRKALFILAFALISALAGVAQDSPTKVEIQGNKIVEIGTTKPSTNYTQVPTFTYQEKDGTEYNIFIREDGRCFINKISKKSGNEYKKWLDEETCKFVCSQMNMQYTYVKKEKNSSK